MGGQLLQNGDVLDGRYKIVRPLASGGMGSVFLAEHWLIHRKVAIKILHPELARDATILRRFMNEAVAAGSLGHPHIVESTDMGFTQHDVPYIVFEYLEGKVLADEIAAHAPLPIGRTLAIAHQIASALGAAHDAQIIHRDLKADNIFLAKRGGSRDHVKVLDFGISRFLAGSDRTALGGNLMGTPEFMAPEQVTSPDDIDHRVDIYALGVLIHEMLTGNVPFVLTRPNDLDAAHALLARIVSEPPPPLAVPDPLPGLPELVAKLLAKRADDRFQTMGDVQRAIERIAGDTVPVRARARTADPEIAEMSDRTVSGSRLPPPDLVREVAQLGKRWSLSGDALALDMHDRRFGRLARVVSAAADIADDMDIQPHVAIDYPHLRIALGDPGSVAELVFAARLEQWLRERGW
ncbi:MAG TPA: serine/threonine-protein kinase [Kofleriaceae bacterium]|nr:serine/threonine-protein kinase [Kofleriaceae bacterium]